jgi:hypothetical protein
MFKMQVSESSKNGSKNGNKYYKCKECGAQFCELTRNSATAQRYAIVLYCFGLSFRTIGAMLGYGNVAILKWVRGFAEAHYERPMPKGDIAFELDEMWHFLGLKKQIMDMESILPHNRTAY